MGTVKVSKKKVEVDIEGWSAEDREILLSAINRAIRERERYHHYKSVK